jgi:hypothetical protein
VLCSSQLTRHIMHHENPFLSRGEKCLQRHPRLVEPSAIVNRSALRSADDRGRARRRDSQGEGCPIVSYGARRARLLEPARLLAYCIDSPMAPPVDVRAVVLYNLGISHELGEGAEQGVERCEIVPRLRPRALGPHPWCPPERGEPESDARRHRSGKMI